MEKEVYVKSERSRWPTYKQFEKGARIRFNVYLPEIEKETPINFLVISNPYDKVREIGSNTIQLTTDIKKWGVKIEFLRKSGWPVKWNEDMQDWYAGCLELNEENYKKTIEICKRIIQS